MGMSYERTRCSLDLAYYDPIPTEVLPNLDISPFLSCPSSAMGLLEIEMGVDVPPGNLIQLE